MTPSLVSLLAQLDNAKSRLDAKLPLPRYTASSLREKLNLDWIYHSNALAGNSHTLRETKVVLEGIAVGGKKIAEPLDILCHRNAIHYIENRVAQNIPLTAQTLEDLHHILQTFDHKTRTKTPAAEKIRDLLAQRDTLCDTLPVVHPLIRAAHWHALFIRQSPFPGDNGRLARLLLNYDLLLAGYPAAIIFCTEKPQYIAALKQAATSCDALAILIANATLRTLHTMLALLGPSDPALSSSSSSQSAKP
ncbi:Fic family protein [Thalassospira profundimaris]|uniref:Fic family protein n=1 Tax=Thalassospira profundimaris TaxID=502049 RepID=UPI0015F09560|nr:Fic family protein [Thalassospira profundimaris]